MRHDVGVKRVEDFVRLELADLIRMNRLVRGEIDFDGFAKWFEELAADERRALLDMLIAFAGEAGITREVYDEAIRKALLDPQDPWVAQAQQRFWGTEPRWRGLQEIRDAIKSADEQELRSRYLRWAVFVFGVAEGRVYAGETPEHCNHWWHRDLTDSRVVEDLLGNPRFFMTSMKDDRRIKGASWWRRLFGR